MLRQLSIRNFVLIEKLDLSFEGGLSVLTGETGAGKTIILDAFAMALGARGDARSIRKGAKKASISALFELGSCDMEGWIAACEEFGLPIDGRQLELRRVQGADGRTQAFINDTRVSRRTLSQFGSQLVEIHGQHESRALVDAANHLVALDRFAGVRELASDLGAQWREWRRLTDELIRFDATRAQHIEERAHLHEAAEELASLAPKAGEAGKLSERRRALRMSEEGREALVSTIRTLNSAGSPSDQLFDLIRDVTVLSGTIDIEPLRSAINSLEHGLDEVERAKDSLGAGLNFLDADPRELEELEERLFAMRALARRHHVDVEELPSLLTRLEASIERIENSEAERTELLAKCDRQEREYFDSARSLSEQRAIAAEKLEKQVNLQLPGLHLGQAKFVVGMVSDGDDPGPNGLDHIEFRIQTNPNTAEGPLGKVASGGELSRIVLALKVVLARHHSVRTLIFDEVDAGAGGAVADAIGRHIEGLAQNSQVITVTHAPQVAARAAQHYKITKSVNTESNFVRCSVTRLNAIMRNEEVARMLAGKTISNEARDAARALLNEGAT